MSKSVLMSIRPEWCQLIVDGKKTVEVRKTRPKLETPFMVYIYCTVGGIKRMPKDYLTESFERGKVIGEFVCSRLSYIEADVDIFGGKHLYNTVFLQNSMCMSNEELFQYLYRGEGKKNGGWAWDIRELVIYDKPKELSEFMNSCNNDLYCEICAMFREFEDLCGNYALVIKRPPQSWCYVEEMEGGTYE